MIYLLNQMKNYRGEGITAKLFYEGKVAEAVSLYINDHFSLKLSLEQLARIACMGTTKLKKLFKQVHGCTISEYIQQRRMSHAESLLATTDLTVEQISVSACALQAFVGPTHFIWSVAFNSSVTPAAFISCGMRMSYARLLPRRSPTGEDRVFPSVTGCYTGLAGVLLPLTHPAILRESGDLSASPFVKKNIVHVPDQSGGHCRQKIEIV